MESVSAQYDPEWLIDDIDKRYISVDGLNSLQETWEDEIWGALIKYTPKVPGRPHVPEILWYNGKLRQMKRRIQNMINDRRNADPKRCKKRKRKPNKRKFTDEELSKAQSLQSHALPMLSQASSYWNRAR